MCPILFVIDICFPRDMKKRSVVGLGTKLKKENKK